MDMDGVFHFSFKPSAYENVDLESSKKRPSPEDADVQLCPFPVAVALLCFAMGLWEAFSLGWTSLCLSRFEGHSNFVLFRRFF